MTFQSSFLRLFAGDIGAETIHLMTASSVWNRLSLKKIQGNKKDRLLALKARQTESEKLEDSVKQKITFDV